MKSLLDAIIYFASLIGAVVSISAVITRFLNKKLCSVIEPVRNQIHKMDVKECRRFLIDFLVDVENGVLKNEVQWKFAHDVYDHYTKDLKENSYVKDFWERVVVHGNHE